MINGNEKELDQLINLLKNPDKLSEADAAQLQALERIDYADNQIRKYPRLKDAALQIQAKFSVSKTTAYNLIRQAQYVHSSTSVYVKDYWRNMLIEKALITLDKCLRNSLHKEFNLTMKNLILLFGFGLEDDNKIKAEMLQQHNYIMNVNFKDSSESYQIDMNKLQNMGMTEKIKMIRAVEMETIEFDMVEKIEQEEKEDAG